MLVLVDDQQHWLNRATEMRALADWIQAGETATIARRIARDYELLAIRAAARSALEKSHDAVGCV
jgi:hypothetical protein